MGCRRGNSLHQRLRVCGTRVELTSDFGQLDLQSVILTSVSTVISNRYMTNPQIRL